MYSFWYIYFVFQADLAVHKKKVGEVQQWLEFALSSVGLLVKHLNALISV